MTLDEKIELLQAAKAGKRIQNKSRISCEKFAYFTDWRDFAEPIDETSFNFFVYDYRIAPENSIAITTRKGTNYEVTVNEDGSISFGCETIEKKDVDAIFALRDKAKLCS